MSERVIAAIVKRSLRRLGAALMEMEEDHRALERTRAEAPAHYSERIHALTMAMHIQGLYSRTEELLDRVMEERALGLRRATDWRPLLLQSAVVDIPGGPAALLSEATFAGLESMRKMHQAILDTAASNLKPARILEFLPEAREAIERTIGDLSHAFGA